MLAAFLPSPTLYFQWINAMFLFFAYECSRNFPFFELDFPPSTSHICAMYLLTSHTIFIPFDDDENEKELEICWKKGLFFRFCYFSLHWSRLHTFFLLFILLFFATHRQYLHHSTVEVCERRRTRIYEFMHLIEKESRLFTIDRSMYTRNI